MERSDNGDDSFEGDEQQTVTDAPAHEQRPGEHSQAVPHSDSGNEKRRRRRRRGRRGRRPDGDTSNGAQRPPMQRGEFQSSVIEHTPYEARHDSVATDQVEPNAPSSPQWSLSEHRVETHAGPRDPELERVAAQEDFARSNIAEAAAAVETAEPETMRPREARKGWWQRRFKI